METTKRAPMAGRCYARGRAHSGSVAGFAALGHREKSTRCVGPPNISHNICRIPLAHKKLLTWSDRQDAYYDLHVLGRLVNGASEDLSGKYLALCEFIIARQFSPKEVTKELLSVGMDPARISDVKAVCFTSREIYAEFKLRLMGWKAALRRIRQGVLTDEQRRQRQVQRVANQFEKVDFGRVGSFQHEGNGRCVLMWFCRDVTESKVFNFDGYRVSVRKSGKTPQNEVNKR